jgi:hypothetical protein
MSVRLGDLGYVRKIYVSLVRSLRLGDVVDVNSLILMLFPILRPVDVNILLLSM